MQVQELAHTLFAYLVKILTNAVAITVKKKLAAIEIQSNSKCTKCFKNNMH